MLELQALGMCFVQWMFWVEAKQLVRLFATVSLSFFVDFWQGHHSDHGIVLKHGELSQIITTKLPVSWVVNSSCRDFAIFVLMFVNGCWSEVIVIGVGNVNSIYAVQGKVTVFA